MYSIHPYEYLMIPLSNCKWEAKDYLTAFAAGLPKICAHQLTHSKTCRPPADVSTGYFSIITSHGSVEAARRGGWCGTAHLEGSYLVIAFNSLLQSEASSSTTKSSSVSLSAKSSSSPSRFLFAPAWLQMNFCHVLQLCHYMCSAY